MFLQRTVVVLLFFSLLGCGNSSSNTSNFKNNVQLLDTVIDYTSVDVYPLFSNCTETDEKHSQKECFDHALTEKLSKSLHKVKYKVKKNVNDSSLVKLLINNNGKAKVVSIESPQIIKENLPQLDSIIKASVNELPVIKPAVKRGIPVKSQYKLAVVVRTTN